MKSQADTLKTSEDFHFKSANQVNLVVVSEVHAHSATEFIGGCEACTPAANLSFDYVLDGVTELDPTSTEYILPDLISCPSCGAKIDTKTLVTVA